MSNNHTKRAKQYNVSELDYSVNLKRVCEKYGNICQQCNTRVIRGVHPQRGNSATIEHDIPLSMGGTHTWDNVTLLCHKCNSLNNTIAQSKAMRNIVKNILKISLFGFVLTMSRSVK